MYWPDWVRATNRVAKGVSAKPVTPIAQLMCILDHYQIELVLDVGANRGQYAQSLRKAGYQEVIRSFEPLPDLNEILTQLSEDDPFWFIEPPSVIGSRNGSISFSRSAEDDMSSVLPQSALQARISPSSAIVETIELTEQRLDSIICELNGPSHLKLDVQGFEQAVLDGAGKLLPLFTTLQLELSMVTLYDGEKPWKEMIAQLDHAGFDLHLILPGYFERKIARQLQFDGVFVNRNAGRT